MIRICRVVTLSAVLMIASCSSEAPQSASVSVPPCAPAPGESGGAAQASGFAYSPLPAGIVLMSPYQVRVDRVYVTSKGEERRTTSLELLEGNVDSLAQDILRQLADTGYTAMNIPEKNDGVTRRAVRKKSVGRINVSNTEKLGAKPSNPRSVGVISFDWPLGPASDTPPANTAGG